MAQLRQSVSPHPLFHVQDEETLLAFVKQLVVEQKEQTAISKENYLDTVVDSCGNSLIFFCVRNRFWTVAELIYANGGNILKENNFGFAPYDYLTPQNLFNCLDFYRKYKDLGTLHSKTYPGSSLKEIREKLLAETKIQLWVFEIKSKISMAYLTPFPGVIHEWRDSLTQASLKSSI